MPKVVLAATVALVLLVSGDARHKKLHSRPAQTSLTSPCDSTIPGYWTGFFPQPLYDEYQLAWDPDRPGEWTAIYVDPISGGWTNATGSFGVNNTTASVTFNTGLTLNGSVNAACNAIAWDNGSVWKSSPPVPCSATIPGAWAGFDPQPTGAEYSLTWSGLLPGAWNVTYLNAPVGPSWTAGWGQFSADNLTTTLQLNSGSSLQGSVSGGCGVITWNDGSIWKASPAAPVITDVHIVAMNHLDVGYNGTKSCRLRGERIVCVYLRASLPNSTVLCAGIPILGLINNILNIYFSTYFPRAIAVADALRSLGGPERLIYTTHAWLVHMYLHCERILRSTRCNVFESFVHRPLELHAQRSHT